MESLPFDEPTRWLLGIPAGLVLAWLAGHFALQLARRAEFNAVAMVLRVRLRQIQQSPRGAVYRQLDADALHQLERLLPWWQRHRLRRCLAQYTQACAQTHQNALGEVLVDNPEAIAAAAGRLLQLVQHRG